MQSGNSKKALTPKGMKAFKKALQLKAAFRRILSDAQPKTSSSKSTKAASLAALTPVDLEFTAMGVEYAALVIENGARDFEAYAKAMTDALGEAIKPYLKQLYMGAKFSPDMNTEGMSTEAEVSAADVDPVTQEPTVEQDNNDDMAYQQGDNGEMHLLWMMDNNPSAVRKMHQEGTLPHYLEQNFQAYLATWDRLSKELGAQAKTEAARMVLSPEVERRQAVDSPLSPQERRTIMLEMMGQ
jgi:hypothetical protein